MTRETPSHTLGRSGEELAVRFLRRRGYHIRETNARSPLGEIDIIADGPAGSGDPDLVFIEVKTRRSAAFGSPLEAVGPDKRQRLTRLAEAWLQQHPALAGRTCRIDVIGITLTRSGDPVIEHVESAI